MMIYSIQKRFGDSLRGWLTLCGIATLGTGSLLSGTVHGQSASGYGYAVPASWAQSPGMNATAGGEMSYGGDSYRVVNAASMQQAGASDSSQVMQAAGLAENSLLARGGTVAPVSYNGGCSTCGTSSCGGSCGNSGFGGIGGFGGNASNSGYLGSRYGSQETTACGTPCNPYTYGSIEGLYMRRAGDDRYTQSANFRLNEFDYEWAPRITIGAVPDCQHGYEVSYTGPYNWDQSASLTSGTGGIQTLLRPGLPIAAADLTAFSNATAQSQFYNSKYWSLEASQTLIGWEFAKVLYGFRYVDFQEDYRYLSSTATEVGVLNSSVRNRLYGGQIGLDLLYPISCHAYADFRGRAGIYLNDVSNNTLLINGGRGILANDDSDNQFAGLFEIGSGLRYQLGDALSIRGGAEYWYLSGVGTAIDQVSTPVLPGMGSRVSANSDVFFLGLTVGAELKF